MSRISLRTAALLLLASKNDCSLGGDPVPGALPAKVRKGPGAQPVHDASRRDWLHPHFYVFADDEHTYLRGTYQNEATPDGASRRGWEGEGGGAGWLWMEGNPPAPARGVVPARPLGPNRAGGGYSALVSLEPLEIASAWAPLPATRTLICFGRAASALGRVRRSMPFSKVASAAFASISNGTESVRWKLPRGSSCRYQVASLASSDIATSGISPRRVTCPFSIE